MQSCRQLRTFALLAPSIRKGAKLDDPIASRIYARLKEHGFRETPWQYVYDGQLGGLVFPIGNGLNEVHIRFYKDRCFAEYEIGRALISHFFGPQFNANALIEEMTRDYLTTIERAHLLSMLTSNQRVDEISLQRYDVRRNIDPYAALARRVDSYSTSVWRHFAGLSWTTIAFVLFPMLCLAGVGQVTSPVLLGMIVVSVLGGFALPSVGRP